MSTCDHLLALTLLLGKSKEWGNEVWVCLVDFEKAFDTVAHEKLWATLRTMGVTENYTRLLHKLYSNQTASVFAGTESRSFSLNRGVKQGDPISSLLFLAVMEACFRPLKEKWQKLNKRRAGHYFGIVIDNPDDPLLNLRFADDVALVAQSRQDIGKMLGHLHGEVGAHGLQIHWGKTKVLTTSPCLEQLPVKCGTERIEVITGDGAER